MTKKLAAFTKPKAAPREPARPAADEARARAFVGGEVHAKPEKLAIYLAPELAEAFRIGAVKARRSLSDVATEAIGEWLEKEGIR